MADDLNPVTEVLREARKIGASDVHLAGWHDHGSISAIDVSSGKRVWKFETPEPEPKMLAHVAATAPIQRNVTIEDVGNTAAFLCSDLAAGISGEVIYVDGGFHTVGMSFPAENDGA